MRLVGLLLLLFTMQVLADTAAPEAASGLRNRPAVYSRHSMVSTANPYASQAARDTLRRGGSAIDAAITAQLVLGLTEPQSSGIGGGAFMLYFDGHKLTSFDGRETAPASADGRLFLQADGNSMDFYRAVVGGRSVGVPGVVAMLKLAHQHGGKLPWASLFQPAIQLARSGFAISPRLHTLLANERFLQQDPTARDYFYQGDGTPRPVGSILKNPDYAATLEQLAQRGPAGFYQGEIANAIIAAVNRHPVNPGHMLASDLTAYQAIERKPLCGPYRSWQVCGMDAPSSGGVAVLQMLGLLQRFPMASMSSTASKTIHLFAEAGKLAFADRSRYLADPGFVPVPSAALINHDYLQQRSQLIDPAHSMGSATAGEPAGFKLSAYGRDNAPELPSTSHLNIVDRAGRVVSMTSSIEDQFGSRLLVKGFLLNNQLTDFSFQPDEDGTPVANRVEAHKRPRSSMSPTLVFNARGQFVLATGSPGGSQIIGYVSQALLAMLDWQQNPQQAVSLPHYGNRNGVTELEVNRGLASAMAALRALGHTVQEVEMTSGLSAIVRTAHGYAGGADPRREGVVLGD
jgi:gamma-glutamyltranspeptidase/glutathione hydrolase